MKKTSFKQNRRNLDYQHMIGRKLITNKKLTSKPPTRGNERTSAIISFTGRKGRLHPSVTSRTDSVLFIIRSLIQNNCLAEFEKKNTHMMINILLLHNTKNSHLVSLRVPVCCYI